MADPHWVLGVPKSATKDEIKKAYRRLCLQHHPDRHAMSPEHVQKSASAAFKAVTEAYELLTNGPAHTSGRRAGFRNAGPSYSSARSATGSSGAYHDAYSSHFSGYGRTYSGFNQFRRRTHFNFGSAFRSLTSFGRHEALLTLGVGGLILGGALLFERLASSFWERQNQGKLFSHMEADLLAAQREESRRLKAQRAAAKEESGAAAAAAATWRQQEQERRQERGGVWQQEGEHAKREGEGEGGQRWGSAVQQVARKEANRVEQNGGAGVVGFAGLEQQGAPATEKAQHSRAVPLQEGAQQLSCQVGPEVGLSRLREEQGAGREGGEDGQPWQEERASQKGSASVGEGQGLSEGGHEGAQQRQLPSDAGGCIGGPTPSSKD